MSLIFKSLKNEEGRCRISNIYHLLVVEENNLERSYLIDMNHKASLVNGRFVFEKNTRIDENDYRIRKPWDYNQHPINSTVLTLIGNGDNLQNKIIEIVNNQFREQEKEWKILNNQAS